MTDKPLVSVVIPTYTRWKKLKRLLDSVLKSDYKNIEVIVVDDASTDGTFEEVKDYYPTVRLVRNSKPLLLSACRNIGLRESKGDFVFFVDDDNVLDRGAVSSLVEVLNSHSDMAVVGPLMLYLLDPERVWCAGVRRNMVTSKTCILDQNCKSKCYATLVESDDFPNAFMVRKAIAMNLGGFDSKAFPIHYDEADFGQRVRMAGYKIAMNPGARVWHDIPIPHPQKDGILALLHMRSAQRTFFVSRNRLIFMKRYASGLKFFLFFFWFYPALSTVYLSAIITSKHASAGKGRLFTSYLRGTLDGLRWKD
jgi:GT2 family glycosyltransferase